MIRRLLKHPGLKRILGRLLGLYLDLTYRTIRWRLDGFEHMQPLLATATPLLLTFWHERLAIMSQQWIVMRRHVPKDKVSGYAPYVLSSRNRDGDIARLAYERFGLLSISGSSSKGGISGLAGMLRVMRNGHVTVITPDGPRGPRRQAAGGAAWLAIASKAPAFALAGSVSRALVLNSWDRLMIPLPFARGVLVMTPITVTEDRNETKAGMVIALNEACARADRLAGRAPDPAPGTAA